MKTCAPGLMIFLLFIMVIMSAPGNAYGRISLKERDALEALYNKTGGKNWDHKENWKKAPGTESSWTGITLDASNTTVIKIEFKNNNLQGVLPVDMEAFSNLVALDLSQNQLTGEIPCWIEKLKKLKTLNLSENNFRGPIPAWLGNLKNLEELFLDNNRLEGSIPGELGNLVNLKVLRIAGNRLYGEIPSDLAKLANLEDNQSDFKWNGLYTQDGELKNFLNQRQIDKDWESTQTVPPAEIKVNGFTDNSIKIEWQPITYTTDKGGYRIFYREASCQDYNDKLFKEIKGKAVREVILKSLKKATKYIFKIFTWTESHSKNKNEIKSVFSNEFPTATGGIIISGTITYKKNGEGFPGVQLTASNGGGTAETDKACKYELNVRAGWTGEVKPYRKGFKFSPPSINYEREVSSDSNAKDYIAESDTVISGTVTFKGKAVANVTIKFEGTNGDDYSVLTDTNGNYQQVVSYGWYGTITPIKDGHGFSPPERKPEIITASKGGQDFEVLLNKIHGQVKSSTGKGINGVRLFFSKIENGKFSYLKEFVETDKNGKFENAVLANWIGKITPKSITNNRYYYFYYPPDIEIKNPDEIKKTLNFRTWRYLRYFFSIEGISMNIFSNSQFKSKILFSPSLNIGFYYERDGYLFARVDFNSKQLISNSSGPVQCFILGICGLFEKNQFMSGGLQFGIVRVKFKKEEASVLVSGASCGAWGILFELPWIFNINDKCFLKISYYSVLGKNISPNGGFNFGFGYRFNNLI